MKNIKIVTVKIESQLYLDRINSTPALKQMFRENLVVGENKIHTNHFNYSTIKRMEGSLYQLID